MLEQFRRPAVVAGVKGTLRCCQRFVRTAGQFDIALAGRHRRQLVQVRRIRVVPAHVVLVHGPGVVAHRAVIAAHVQMVLQGFGQRDRLCHFGTVQAGVDQAHGLVMNELVGVALLGDEITDAFLAPDRPVVLVEHHFRFAHPLQRLVHVVGPLQGITHLGTAHRVNVVQGLAHHLGTIEGFQIRQRKDEFRWCFAAGHVVKDETHTVEQQLLHRLVHQQIRFQNTDPAIGHRLAQAVIDQALGVARQETAVHIAGAAPHRRPHQDVLAGGLFHEAQRRHHRHLARDHLLGADHTQRATKVVDVAVRENDGGYRLVAQVLTGKGHGRGRSLARRQCVHHNPSGLALDQRQVRQIKTAYLPDAISHLEQPDVVIQHRLAPQTRVHGRRCRALDEGKSVEVPDDGARCIPDLTFGCGDETAFGISKGRCV